MARPPWFDYDRACKGALHQLEHDRHQIDLWRESGGYDEKSLQWAESYIAACEQALSEGDLGLLLAYHHSLVSHMVWSRHPILKDEALRDRQSANAKPGESRSWGKQEAMRLYREADPRPLNCRDFVQLLTDAGISWTQSAAGKWFTEARKHPQT